MLANPGDLIPERSLVSDGVGRQRDEVAVMHEGVERALRQGGEQNLAEPRTISLKLGADLRMHAEAPWFADLCDIGDHVVLEHAHVNDEIEPLGQGAQDAKRSLRQEFARRDIV